MKHTIGFALALSLAFFPACSKEKKPEVEKAPTESADKTPDGTEDSKAKAAAGASKIALTPGTVSAELRPILKHMPQDTEILVSMNLASLTNTPLWEKLGPAAMEKAGGSLAKAKATCGFDPISKLTSIHFGVNSAREKEAVVVIKGLTRGPLVACIQALAKVEGAVIEVTDDGNFTTVKGKKDGETQGLVWIDDNTLLLVPGKVDKAYLQARLDGENGLIGNADFTMIAGKANQGAPIWFAASFSPSSKAAKSMASLGSAPKGLYGSVGFSDGIQLALGVTFEDENAARTMLGSATAMMGMAKGPQGPLGKLSGLIDKVQLSTEAADLKVSLDMNKQEVDELSNMASAFTKK
jgi:hypothetical protein